MRPSSTSTEPNLRELALLALMGALMFALQVAMASIPNVHLTALLIILTAIFFGWKCLFSVAVFVILEAFVWGFGLWWLCYWYLWPLLAIPAVLLRKNRSAFLWAVLAAIHGLTFGAFCSIPYLFIGGWELALSYWVSGLSFDLIHCGGNFVLTLVLFNPLYRVMDKLLGMYMPR